MRSHSHNLCLWPRGLTTTHARACGCVVCRYFALASTLGFALNLLSFWIIRLTSSVMLKIISVARTAALVLWCAAFLHEQITPLEALGYTISLSGFAVYNRLRITETAEAKANQHRVAGEIPASPQKPDHSPHKIAVA